LAREFLVAHVSYAATSNRLLVILDFAGDAHLVPAGVLHFPNHAVNFALFSVALAVRID